MKYRSFWESRGEAWKEWICAVARMIDAGATPEQVKASAEVQRLRAAYDRIDADRLTVQLAEIRERDRRITA